MVISGKEAVIFCAFIKFANLAEAELAELIEDALAEKDEPVAAEEDKNKYARQYLAYRFSNYTNAYLQLFLRRHLHILLVVRGRRKKLYTCECCGFKTLTLPGEWDICKVCFWENDGSARDESIISSPNHMTLGEAKKNFLKFGASHEGSLRLLDTERFLQFARDIENPNIPQRHRYTHLNNR